MQRVLLPWLLEKLNEIRPLSTLKAGRSGGMAWATMMTAKEAISTLTKVSVYAPHLKVCAPKAKEVEEMLETILNKIPDIKAFDLTDYDVWRLQNQKDSLETVLMSELGTLPVYLVSAKDAYNTEKLITSGKELFPPLLLNYVPEAWVDAHEVGKCLAFELNTACGFHTFRVVELVVRKYWTAIAKGKEHPSPATLGNYAAQMKICTLGDEKVYESLIQLSKLHRNPISHPEVFLNSEEAIAVLGMARSVIAYMLPSLNVIPTLSYGDAAIDFTQDVKPIT